MAFRSLALSVGFLVILWGCGESPGDPRISGGSSGGGGTAGSGGSAGSGGTAGSGGSSGSGGGGVVDCTTSLLCLSCPSGSFCETDGDCSVGFSCIETGCDDVGGQALKQCTFAGGGACDPPDEQCSNGRECVDVPGEGKRCVKTTPGCDTSFDCVLGFACENGSCVDRRVPCDPQDEQCPKNHVCGGTTNSNFCRRIHQGCEFDFDCVDLAPRCEDIDGDLKKECAGTFDLNDPMSNACTNAQCVNASAPVCEAASFGSTTQCGQYGLCLGDGDCAAGFSCLELWPDGRMECVLDGGSCSSFADCPMPRQVCASPRDGGAPSCQAGLLR
jgi:hypothetical protein